MLLWTIRQRNACDGIICNDWKTVLFERGKSETDCGEKKIAINSNKWWNSPTKKEVYVYLCSGFSSEWARKKKLACEFSLPPLLLYPRSHELLGWGRGNTAMRWEKRIIDALEILNNIEALKIKLADGTARAKPTNQNLLLTIKPKF